MFVEASRKAGAWQQRFIYGVAALRLLFVNVMVAFENVSHRSDYRSQKRIVAKIAIIVTSEVARPQRWPQARSSTNLRMARSRPCPGFQRSVYWYIVTKGLQYCRHTVNSADLIRMANQITDFFEVYPKPEALDGIAKHIHNMWERRMRNELKIIIEAGGEGLKPLCVEAMSDYFKGPKSDGRRVTVNPVSRRPRAPRRALPAAGATADCKPAGPGALRFKFAIALGSVSVPARGEPGRSGSGARHRFGGFEGLACGFCSTWVCTERSPCSAATLTVERSLDRRAANTQLASDISRPPISAAISRILPYWFRKQAGYWRS